MLRSSLDNLTKERDKLRSDLQVIDGYDDGCEGNDDNGQNGINSSKTKGGCGGAGINSFNDMLKLMAVS